MSVASSPSAVSGAPPAALRWLFSSIGKKTVVALTGIILVLFVIGHMLGNFTVFFGPEAINSYAMHLRDLGPLLWVVRAIMLASVVLHIVFTMLVWKENLAARPQKYAVYVPVKTSVFARTMRLTGLIVLAFVIFHLAQFTLLIVNPSYATLHAELNGRQVHDVYSMVVMGFRNPAVSAFYILSLAFLASHLSHGIASLFQTLGFSNDKLRKRFDVGGRWLAWLLFVGYSSIPISILVFGLGKNIVP